MRATPNLRIVNAWGSTAAFLRVSSAVLDLSHPMGMVRGAVMALILFTFLGAQSLLAQTFTSVADTAGVNDGGVGQGVAWGDYDNDGDLDLYVTNLTGGANRLYRNNRDGTFTEIGADAGVNDTGNGTGVAWGDYDNDGDLDLYVANLFAANRLYRNEGRGKFTEVGEAAGVDDGGNGSGVAWGDYNNDGGLDLYVVNDGVNRLYRNGGGGRFTEQGAIAGVNDSGIGHGLAWGDYDNDGDLDLYVTNDGVNRLYRNGGEGRFTDVGDAADVNDSGVGQGVAWGDYDNDGYLDLYVASYGSENRLYQNDGRGKFRDVGGTAGVGDKGFCIGVAWGDYDNDGDLDLYVTKSTFDPANRLYRNEGGETFTEVSAIAGVDDRGNGNGTAWADCDNDGDLDLYVVVERGGLTPGNNLLYRNNGTANTWLIVKLVGQASNRAGIGAQATAVTGSRRQRRDVDGGSGFCSQPSLPVAFGLGATRLWGATVDSLIIRWPSGIEQIKTNVATNQILTVTEKSPIELPPPDSVFATSGTYTDRVKITWSEVAGASYYGIYRSTSSDTRSAVILGSWQTTTSYDDTSARPGVMYYYWVKAATSSSGANASAYSASEAGYRTASPAQCWGDFTRDGVVDFRDFLLFAQAFGKLDPAYEVYDWDHSGRVDFPDFLEFAGRYGKSCEELSG